MADSYWLGTVDGTTAVFPVPFPFLLQTHVSVVLNGIVLLTPGDYLWTGPSTITLNKLPTAGSTLQVSRSTSPDIALVNFANGAVLTQDDLNTAVLQSIFRTQELQDQLDGYVNQGLLAYQVDGSNAGMTPDQLVAAVASAVLQSSIASTLLSQTAAIATNGQSILDNSNQIVTLQGLVDSLTAGGGTGISTAITTEQNARIAGDTALATTLALIGAANGGNTAFVIDTSTAYIDDTTSLATKLSAIDSTLSGNSASITTLQTTANGLEAQYTVKIDVNGHVAGFGLASTPINGTPVSSFIVAANNFSIVDPGNGLTTPVVPFTVSGGIVSMTNVVIQDALIGSLNVSKLVGGTLTAQVTQNADWFIGTGRIIWTNGAFMKVAGVGFGTTNQFLEWFGPALASPADCTEARAISYLKVDGSAYFGGTLLAGVLSNATQATVLSTSNVADLGPFASNGGNITITWSFLYEGENDYPATSTGLSQYNSAPKLNPTAQLVLSRAVAGGSFSDVLTINISNGSQDNKVPVPTDGTSGWIKQFMSGSGTFADTLHSTSTREYKLRINTASNIVAAITNCVLSIQSVE